MGLRGEQCDGLVEDAGGERGGTQESPGKAGQKLL